LRAAEFFEAQIIRYQVGLVWEPARENSPQICKNAEIHGPVAGIDLTNALR